MQQARHTPQDVRHWPETHARELGDVATRWWITRELATRFVDVTEEHLPRQLLELLPSD